MEATDRVVLNKSSTLEGNVRAPSMVIEAGAIINGQVSMDLEPLAQIPENTGESRP